MTQLERLEGLLADGGIWRMSVLVQAGVTASTVQRAVAAGLVEQVSRGAYRRAGAPHVGATHLAEALVRIPQGIICLHSAARVHGLGDETVARTWVAIPHRCHAPRVEWPPMRYVRWRSPEAFVLGVETQIVAGVQVRLTNPARTVVDMLRMSSTVGEDRALECLRDYLAAGGASPDLGYIAHQLGSSKRVEAVLHLASVWERTT